MSILDDVTQPPTQSMGGQTQDILSRLAQRGVSSSPTPRIQNLLQLGAIAKHLSGVPTEIRNRILSQLLGIQYKSPEEKMLDVMRARYEQAAPDRKIQQARLMESLKNRELIGRANLAMRGRGLDATEANRKNVMDHLKRTERDRIPVAASNLVNTIRQVTASMQTMTNPDEKERALKHIQFLEKMLDAQQTRYNSLLEEDRQSAMDAHGELQDAADEEGDQGNGSEGSAY
jgi:hypothetical protein